MASLVAKDVLYSHVYALDLSTVQKVDDAATASTRFCADNDLFALEDDTGRLTECRFIDSSLYSDRFPWKLMAGEAVLTRLKTRPYARGRGLAPVLIKRASEAMRQRGYRHLFAMVWFSNQPSKRAFEKAGWAIAARHLTIKLRGIKKPLEIIRRA